MIVMAALRATGSDATTRAAALVTARRSAAAALGRKVAGLIADPEAVASALDDGFRRLADAEYRVGQQRVAPGLGPIHGVRWPLLEVAERAFIKAAAGDRPSLLLYVAGRLFEQEPLEHRWFAFRVLEQVLSSEPERTWQLLRRGAREAGDWITVDTLAHAYAQGILLESYRWAELEQLVYSPSRWERRLVGSTIATLPFEDRREGRRPEIAMRGLALVGELIGDAKPDVQKALSWALRSLVLVDPAAVADFCERESLTAAADGDGHRAWVIRDALPRLDPPVADPIRARLQGVRKRPGAPATSRAGQIAAQFSGMGLGSPPAEPPLT